MTEIGPNDAKRELANAHNKLQRGANLVYPHSRWDDVAVILVVTLVCSLRDIPRSWRWLWDLALILAVIGYMAMRQRKARALRIRYGWRITALLAMLAVIIYALMYGLGPVLRALTIPIPFTFSGLVGGIAMVAVIRAIQRIPCISYSEQVKRGIQ